MIWLHTFHFWFHDNNKWRTNHNHSITNNSKYKRIFHFTRKENLLIWIGITVDPQEGATEVVGRLLELTFLLFTLNVKLDSLWCWLESIHFCLIRVRCKAQGSTVQFCKQGYQANMCEDTCNLWILPEKYFAKLEYRILFSQCKTYESKLSNKSTFILFYNFCSKLKKNYAELKGKLWQHWPDPQAFQFV